MSEVALRDGSRVIVRPVRADGKQLLLEGFERFGEQSRYRRFMGMKKRLSDEELAFFTDVDHHDHEALVALDAESGLSVGVARFIRLSGDAAEAAVAIVDDWQGEASAGCCCPDSPSGRARKASTASAPGCSARAPTCFTCSSGSARSECWRARGTVSR
jgi:hypothetical protein